MKVLGLDCIAFGRFTNCKLDFSEPGRVLHIIYGSNEAGKSTALRALMGLLYGIPPRTGDAFLHDMKTLRVAGTLERSDGAIFTFMRRKGNRDTILDVNDSRPIPDTQLLEFLGGVNEEVFDTMFRLDHAALVRGGDDLLAGKGDVAQSLFEAGSGITGLREILDSLDEEADQLFKPRSTTAPINRWIETYNEARGRVRSLSVPPKEWTDKRTVLASSQKELQNLTVKLASMRERQERLRRFSLALPHVAHRKELLKELEEMGPVIELPESAPQEREAATRNHQESSKKKDDAMLKLERFRIELTELTIPTKVLDQEKLIANSYEKLDSYRNAVRDLPIIRAERQRLENEARSLLSEIEPGLTLNGADKLLLTVAQQTRIRTLATQHHKLEERVRNAGERAESTREQWEEKMLAFDAADKPKDIEQLERSLEYVQKQGDLETSLRNEVRQLAVDEKEATVRLNRLLLWTGTLEQLETLSVPATETIDLFEAEWGGLTGKQGVIDSQLDENQQREDGIDKEIQTLRIGGAVPTEQDLLRAREHREKGWQLVRRAWQEGMVNPEEEKAFEPELPLADGFEKAVVNSDSTADRLRREADRVAKLAGLLADKEDCQRRAAVLETNQAELKDKLASWQNQWDEVWQKAAIVPASPKEMRGWLSRHNDLLTHIRGLRQRRQLIAEMEGRIHDCKEDLDRALQEIGEQGASPEERLPTLIQRSKLILNKVSDLTRQRAALEKEVQVLGAQSSEAARTLEKAKQDIGLWQENWEKALAPLSLHADTRVEEATAVLDRLDELFIKKRDSIDREERVKAMERHIAQFDDDVSAIVKELEPGLRDLHSDQAVVRLQALLTAAQKEMVRREGIEDQIEQEREALENANQSLLGAERRLQDLMERAHCADLDGLQIEEQKSLRYRELTALLSGVNNTLAGLAGGAALESMLVELATVNPDQLVFENEELDRDVHRLEGERSALDQKIGSVQASLSAINGGDSAALAAEEAQNALAAIREHTDRYLRLKLASEILRRHIERYREENQDPVVKRASSIFARLTRGSFSSLKTGFDEKDRPVLLGIRPTAEEVGVGGMSDGTRDQLFLALRIASLERQLTSGEPLPFVLDDTLINFDDARAEATISELATLASKTQVLFFTHHARLVELARKVVPETILKVHELGAV